MVTTTYTDTDGNTLTIERDGRTAALRNDDMTTLLIAAGFFRDESAHPRLGSTGISLSEAEVDLGHP